MERCCKKNDEDVKGSSILIPVDMNEMASNQPSLIDFSMENDYSNMKSEKTFFSCNCANWFV